MNFSDTEQAAPGVGLLAVLLFFLNFPFSTRDIWFAVDISVTLFDEIYNTADSIARFPFSRVARVATRHISK